MKMCPRSGCAGSLWVLPYYDDYDDEIPPKKTGLVYDRCADCSYEGAPRYPDQANPEVAAREARDRRTIASLNAYLLGRIIDGMLPEGGGEYYRVTVPTAWPADYLDQMEDLRNG